MRRLHFKPSLAEAKRSTQKAMDFYRSISPNTTARFDAGATEKRERGPVNEAASEAPVKRAVFQLLSVHPKVAIAIRVNGGMAYNENGAPVVFHQLVRGEGVVTDFIGILIDGRPFAIECKRPDWRGVSLEGVSKTAVRERAQRLYIASVMAVNGIGGFARSADEAQAIIESIEGRQE